jgi:H+-transporting ATPase
VRDGAGAALAPAGGAMAPGQPLEPSWRSPARGNPVTPRPCLQFASFPLSRAQTPSPLTRSFPPARPPTRHPGSYEANKAGNAVAALKASLKPNAVCKRDGKWQNMDAATVVPGDLVMLGAGAAVPADCKINHGRIEVDQAALTGESLPVTMTAGSQPKMGSTVTRGEVEATVEYTGSKTFFGKTAAMIQSVEEMSHFQKVLLKIMLFLITISLVLCFTVLGFLMNNEKQPFAEAISFTVVLLVASIPMAMEVVTTTTMAIGSHTLSRAGAIVARLSSIEELAGMNMLCSDKTGTLTMNKMVIQDDTPIYQEGITQKEVIRDAALAAKWHEPPKDALDTLVLGQADIAGLDKYEMVDYMPFDPIFKRTEGTLKDIATGEVFKTTKGAPHIIAKLLEGPGAEAIQADVNAKVDNFAERGIRSLAVARTVGDKWQMQGILTFLDPPRPDTKETLHKAMEYGIDVKMITGDHTAIAKETARQLGIGTNILNAIGLPNLDAEGRPPKDLDKYAPMIIEADGFAQVFPEHKFLIVEALRRQGFAVGMTGDGVNDAPALKKADIGIAVQGSTDAARASADIVLTSPGLSVVIDAITISRCIFQRIQNFVIYRVACTLQLLIFFFIAVIAFQPSDYAVGDRSHPNKGVTDNVALAIFGDSGKPGGALVMWQNSACPMRTWHLDEIELGLSKYATGIDATYLDTNKAVKGTPSYYFAGRDSTVILDTVANTVTGHVCIEQWPRTFAIPVIALIFITLLNDGTIISIAYDHVEPSKYPEKWNLPVTYLISSTLGGVAFAGSILYLHLMLDSHNPEGSWRKWGLGPITYGEATAAMYLKVSLSDFLTLFSARTTKWFFSVRPDYKLYIAAFAALGASTALTARWPVELNEKHLEREFMEEDRFTDKDEFEHIYQYTGTRMNGTPNFVLGVTWLYVFIWWVAQDVIKYALYILLMHFDVLQHKTSMYSNVRGDEGGVSEVSDQVIEAATGRVEGKLVAADVREANNTLNTLERRTQDVVRPKLADLEAAIKAKDDTKIMKASDEISASVSTLDKDDAAKLRQNIVAVKASAERAAKATGSMRSRREGGGASFRQEP